MPLVATRGAASAQGFGEFAVAATPTYIEDVFSCFLYTGTGASQTITNGIDLSTKGGLTWIKGRSGTTGHRLTDTARGVTKSLASETTAAQVTETTGLTAFGTTGFTIGADADYNTSADTYVSWTFRKQPKFFDVVTYTGTGSNTTIAHNLGSVPACIIVKRTDTIADWAVYHSSLANTQYLVLNTTAAAATGATWWNSTTPTSSVFSVGTDASVNASGGTYVAYIYAHNAGGFGLTGTDNVISCGSYTGTGATGNAITFGYEPQFVLVKRTDTTADWITMDAMRGGYLKPNTSDAELGGSGWFNVGGDNFFPTATGFQVNTAGAAWNASGGTYIYIAIRRGPMKVPTSGTSVFAPVLNTGTGANTNISSGSFAPDMLWNKNRDHSYGTEVWDKLRGVRAVGLTTSNTGAEGLSPVGYDLVSFNNTGVTEGANSSSVMNITSWLYVNYLFGRAPSFFDEVCYTGNGAGNNAQTHNLGVAPELLIIKNRSANGSGDWYTFHTFTSFNFKKQLLDTTDAQTNYTYGSFLDAQPTGTTFTVNSGAGCNASGTTYVAYLFATCAGVSKVGTYTGTGTTLQIDCGFTAGARFVLIKRTDSTGDWYVWDSARGIVAGNDPYLLLNDTAAEVTSTDYIDTYNAGFEISSTAPAAINASSGTFIFLAIA